MKIKVSYKSLMQNFHPCDKEFIKNICHGACCESHTKGRNTLITIHSSEQEWIEKCGGKIVNGILETGKKCPFKTLEDLCAIQSTKPFGCIASPFTLTAKDTLIIRNRYRMLRCYRVKEGKVPAYIAHRASLDMLLGKEETQRIIDYIEKNKCDIMAEMPIENYQKLKDNDKIKKGITNH